MAGNRAKLRCCAIYSRKSSEEGLEQGFNSLDAQREACEAYILSQRHEGWEAINAPYDDGGFSGGTTDRPALKRLLGDIEAGKIDVVVVYKVDRLTRSLSDFAKIVEIFDQAGVSFVSVTQQFNTTTSMGRLTLNVLLSFAQFEREVTGERIRDKFLASRKKGMWMGGHPPLGYDVGDRKLVINEKAAETVRLIFRRYTELGCVSKLKADLDTEGITSKLRISTSGRRFGGGPIARGALYKLLANRVYLGEAVHKGSSYPGEHDAIIDRDLWDRAHRMLEENRAAKQNGSRATAPSLLAGLLFDAAGERLSPSHAVKSSKRYRYYVSQSILQGRAKTDRRGVSIPAHEIEQVVTTEIRRFLDNREAVFDAVGTLAAGTAEQEVVLARAAELAARWPQLSPSEQRSMSRALVTTVTVDSARVDIDLSRQGLVQMFLVEDDRLEKPVDDRAAGDDPIRLTVDVRVKRCGLETKMILANGSKADEPRPNEVLIRTIVRAHAWMETLISGEARSIRELARSVCSDERRVTRTLRLVHLAPDITEAILDGRQPPDLTAKKLLKSGPLPIDWIEQRRRLGFAPTR